MSEVAAPMTDAIYERPDGPPVFYPWGRFGSAYELPTPRKVEQVRRLTRGYRTLVRWLSPLVGGAAGALGAFVADDPAGVAAVVAAVMVPLMGGVVGVHTYRLRQLMKGLPVSDEPFPARKAFSQRARAQSWGRLWGLEALALGFVALGVWIMVSVEGAAWVGVSSIVFFGLCAAVFSSQIFVKLSANLSAGPRAD